MPQVSVKSKLVEHAEHVFRRQGFSGASVQDITSAAGVPKGSFYNHFASKQALAVEIVTGYVSATDLERLSGEGSPLERLRSHFAAQWDRTQATGTEFGCLLGTFAGEACMAGSQVRAAVTDGLEAWTSAVAETVRAGQEEGQITSDRPAGELAAFLIDTFEGGALRVKAAGDLSVVPQHMELALKALRA